MMHALCKHIEIYVLEIHKLYIYPDIYIYMLIQGLYIVISGSNTI